MSWGEGGCPICSEKVSALLLKKQLMPVTIELLVILNHSHVCCDMNFFCFKKNYHPVV